MKYKKLKYVIFSPPEFVSGGALVLHLLCHLLNQKEYNAKIFLSGVAKKQKEASASFWLRWFYVTGVYIIKKYIFKCFKGITVIQKSRRFKLYSNESHNNPIKRTPFISKNTVVVYPEIISGNPLNADNVVRWLLHKPGYHTKEIFFGENDLFFAYQSIFNDKKLNPTSRLLTISFINDTLCKQTNFEKRKGNCYIIRKGKNRDDLPKSFDGAIIDDMTEVEIAAIFNKCKYCISYDTMTFYSSFATICGCISIVVPMPGVTKEQWQPDEEKRYGIAYGLDEDEITHAINTQNLVHARINDQKMKNEQAIDYFINEVNSFFNQDI